MSEPVIDVTEVIFLSNGKVDITFSDGKNIVADIKPLLVGPIFDEIFMTNILDKGFVNPESGTLEWSNGAYIAPEALYELT